MLVETKQFKSPGMSAKIVNIQSVQSLVVYLGKLESIGFAI